MILGLLGLVWSGDVSAELDGSVYRVLSLRDGVSCAALPGVGSVELRDVLVGLSSPEVMPGVVPMRAVGCLMELYPADPVVLADLQLWVVDPARRGQALLVLDGIDRLGLAGVPVAQAALSVGDPLWLGRFRERVGVAGLEEVRVLAK